VVTRFDEPSKATATTVPSKIYQKGLAVLVILVSAAALFALLDFIPD